MSRGALSACFLVLAGFFFIVATQSNIGPTDDEVTGSGRYLFIKAALRTELEDAIRKNSKRDIQERARKLAARAPTDPFPYEAALALSYSDEDPLAASRFATLALMRQPRSLAGHLHLFSESAARRNYDHLLRHYGIMARLHSLDGELLADALVGVFRESGDWSPLLTYLENVPPTGVTLMQRVVHIDALTSEVGALARKYPEIQVNYLGRLINDRGAEEAYLAWRSFVSTSHDVSSAIPFNGTFKTLNAPPPFNWSIHYDRADLQDDGGLYVSYPGTGTPLIARQIIKAPSGLYVLRTEAAGRMEENGGVLEWQVHCLEAPKQLLRSTIQIGRSSVPDAFDAALRVPDSGCDFQVLELQGQPGIFPKLSRVTIVSVSLIGSIKSEN